MKKIVFLGLLGILFLGCKAKRTVAHTPREKPKTETASKKHVPREEKGLYDLPEDTGKFVTFEIASPEEYIKTFAEISQMEMQAYGIPASITLAQGLLESGLGKGALALKTNNHFGIKCHTGWEGDYDFHDDDEKGECFRKYNHPMYSFRDHSLFLTTRSRYASLFQLAPNDYKGWAHGLQKAGYATDKRYPQKLIQLIERYGLHKYDGEAKPRQMEKTEIAMNAPEHSVHVVQKGDTLYSISRKYAVSVDDLRRWNYIYGDTLSVGQELTVKTEKFNN